ncbi:MAG: hypothetical protein GFH27_549287n26 [Chloroflexi bacterium AL-W]|nr:hypothetical protein [Chloroflexi bacterium AL-W]
MIRPQPVGIFPLPASYLIVPSVAGADALCKQLLRGQIPENVPDSLCFYTLACAGETETAWQCLTDETPEGRYNRFILKSTPELYRDLHEELTGELTLLLDVAAYTLGYIDVPPGAGEVDAELRAFVLMSQAAHALEYDDGDTAATVLQAAVDAARASSPLLAAQLLSNLAETQHRYQGVSAIVAQNYRAALQLLDDSALSETRANVALSLGLTYHELAQGQRGALLEAVKCYQEALQVFSKTHYPELYALAQNNLALAYLSMPLIESSDQLRMGIAVQSLRETLKIYTPESHPEQWASAQLNLANALQYLPSSHPEDNLVEAVELYEAVIAVRDYTRDPFGYARVLANQGNALAHLGIFVHAKPKLQEALRVFTAYGDVDSATSLRSVLDEIEQNEHDNKGAQDGTISTSAV